MAEQNITLLLHRWREGSETAGNELFRLALPDLRRLAGHFMRKERPGHSLQSGDLVDQIYFKLVAAKDRDWQNRGHFVAFAARAMRRHLIERARRRGSRQFVPFEDLEAVLHSKRPQKEMALTVAGLLGELEQTKPELCSVVELKFFLGLDDREAAEALGVTLRTFQRRWQDARKWLFQRLNPDHGGPVEQR